MEKTVREQVEGIIAERNAVLGEMNRLPGDQYTDAVDKAYTDILKRIFRESFTCLYDHAALFASSEEVAKERDELRARIDRALAKASNFDTDYAASILYTIEEILSEDQALVT